MEFDWRIFTEFNGDASDFCVVICRDVVNWNFENSLYAYVPVSLHLGDWYISRYKYAHEDKERSG